MSEVEEFLSLFSTGHPPGRRGSRLPSSTLAPWANGHTPHDTEPISADLGFETRLKCHNDIVTLKPKDPTAAPPSCQVLPDGGIFLHTNLSEELGWTGFLQSTRQDRRGPLLASLIVVPFFALFHLPARFVAGWIVDDHTPPAQVPTVALGNFALAAVVAVLLRVLIMWVYNGSGRSVILVGLFHSAFNMTIGNEVMPELLNLPASETSLMCLGVLAVLAVAVVVFTRGRLAYQGRPAWAMGVAAQPRVR